MRSRPHPGVSPRRAACISWPESGHWPTSKLAGFVLAGLSGSGPFSQRRTDRKAVLAAARATRLVIAQLRRASPRPRSALTQGHKGMSLLHLGEKQLEFLSHGFKERPPKNHLFVGPQRHWQVQPCSHFDMPKGDEK